MKMLSLALFTLISLNTAHADTLSDLIECKITCSQHCRELALTVNEIAKDVLNGCADNDDSSQIVKACASTFGTGSSGLQCVEGARTGEIAKKCASNFGTGSSGLQCVKNARSAKTVLACVGQFGSGSSGLNCLVR